MSWLTRKRDVESPVTTLHKELNQLFHRFFEDTPLMGEKDWAMEAFSPKIDIAETDKAIEITAELPGMEEKDVEVTLNDNVLTIKGEKKQQKEEKEKDYYRMERSYGSFQRTIPFTCEIVSDKTQAHFKNGVLKVSLAKSQEAKARSRRIEIKAN